MRQVDPWYNILLFKKGYGSQSILYCIFFTEKGQETFMVIKLSQYSQLSSFGAG